MARQTAATVDAAPAFDDAPVSRGWEYATAEDALRADQARAERSVESRRMERYLHYRVSEDEPVRELATADNLRAESQADDPPGL